MVDSQRFVPQVTREVFGLRPGEMPDIIYPFAGSEIIVLHLRRDSEGLAQELVGGIFLNQEKLDDFLTREKDERESSAFLEPSPELAAYLKTESQPQAHAAETDFAESDFVRIFRFPIAHLYMPASRPSYVIYSNPVSNGFHPLSNFSFGANTENSLMNTGTILNIQFSMQLDTLPGEVPYQHAWMSYVLQLDNVVFSEALLPERAHLGYLSSYTHESDSRDYFENITHARIAKDAENIRSRWQRTHQP